MRDWNCVYDKFNCMHACLVGQMKADKIMANAKDEAIRIKARANEDAEKTMADSKTQAEQV